MNKIWTFCALIATIQTAQACEYGTTTAARLRCAWHNDTAPEYFTGCYDILAPIEGAANAAEICAAEYTQHLDYLAKAKIKNAADAAIAVDGLPGCATDHDCEQCGAACENPDYIE